MNDEVKKPSRRWPKVLLAVLLIGAAAASIGWLIGPRIWTDGRSIRAANGKAALRDVLWDLPRDLGPQFNSDEQQYEPALSPDGTEFYFVRNKPGRNSDIYVSYRKNNQWTPPVALDGVNSAYDDLGPRLTADGKFLLFYSDRPGGFGGYDIWASRRTDEGWEEPFNLGPQVNTEYNEFSPDPTPDGKHLIFSTNRKAAGGQQKQAWRATIRQTENGDYDLWMAEVASSSGDISFDRFESGRTRHGRDSRVTMEQQEVTPSRRAGTGDDDTSAPTDRRPSRDTGVPPVPGAPTDEAPTQPRLSFLPAHEIPGVNTQYMEGASCMSPAGDFLYFASNRPGGFGKFDIYRSRVFVDDSGQWKFAAPQNVGAQINTADNETDPALALNGFRLYLSSDRGNSDGAYRLLSSDSREVYPTFEGRPLPRVGLSFWLMLASLLVLVPLLLFLRGWDERRLGILQKCLLLSLLAHVAICFLLSFLTVTTQAIHYVRQEMGIELPVALSAPGDLEVGYAIRRQSTGDLPAPGAPPQEMERTQSPIETVAVAGPVDVNVPAAHVQPGEIVVQVTAPVSAPVGAKPQAAEVAVAAPPAEMFDVRVALPRAVSQVEAVLQASSVDAQVARAMIPSSAQTVAKPVSVPTEAASAPNASGISNAIAPAQTSPRIDSISNSTDIVPASDITGNFPPVGLANNSAKVQSIEQSPAIAGLQVASASATLSRSSANPSAAPGAKEIAVATEAAQPGNSLIGQTAKPADGFRPMAIPVEQASAAPGTTDLFSAPTVGSPNSEKFVARVPTLPTTVPVAAEVNVAAAPRESSVALNNPTGIAADLPRSSAPAASQVETSVSESASVHRTPIAASSSATDQAMASSNLVQPDPLRIAGLPANSQARPHAVDEHSPVLAEVVGPTSRPIETRSTTAPDAVVSKSALNIQPTDTPAVSAVTSSLAQAMKSLSRPVEIVESGKDPGPDPFARTVAGALDAPQVALPKGVAPTGAGGVTRAGGGAEKHATADAVAFAASRANHDVEGGGGAKNVYVDAGIAPIAAIVKPVGDGRGSDPLQSHDHAAVAVSESVIPESVALILPPNDVGPTLPATVSPFKMRAPEQHKPILEKLGGTAESENAVDRGLAYLASVQEEEGRWTFVGADRRPPRVRPIHPHDPACTGLATLAFLAQDHRPDKPGPYQEKVAKALEFLLSIQLDNGDLRGPLVGGGADQGNMYDHGIATFALAEAALMTRDPRYINAAIKGANFIVSAQNRPTGGWRYIPQEPGDSSVFGWQIMALHSAEQLGFEIPTSTLRGAVRYIASSSSGAQHMLAGYQPANSPTAPMTAEVAFSRMLLGQQLTDEESQEIGTYLGRQPPTSNDGDIYYWYYGSLCMMQMHNDNWTRWNTRMRDMLVRTQHRTGENAGYWDNLRWSERGGRVFTTAMATLTLEVYYRYNPLQKKGEDAILAGPRLGKAAN